MDLLKREQFLLYRIRQFEDQTAFAAIYDLYKERIYRNVYLKLPTPSDAEEITAETFIRLWEYLRSTDVESVGGVIFAIARNLVADFYRHREKLQEVPVGDQETLGFIASDEGKQKRGNESHLDAEKIAALIKRLKPEYQDAITMSYIDGMSIEEIAQALHKSHGNVRVLIHRALNAIRGIASNGSIRN